MGYSWLSFFYAIIVSIVLHALILIFPESSISFDGKSNEFIEIESVEKDPLGNSVTSSEKVSKKTSRDSVRNQELFRQSEQAGGEQTGLAVANGDTSLSLSGEEVGIDITYPRMSRVLGEVGKVVVMIKKEDAQFIVNIIQSSGFERLDVEGVNGTFRAINQGLLEKYFINRDELRLVYEFRLTGG